MPPSSATAASAADAPLPSTKSSYSESRFARTINPLEDKTVGNSTSTAPRILASLANLSNAAHDPASSGLPAGSTEHNSARNHPAGNFTVPQSIAQSNRPLTLTDDEAAFVGVSGRNENPDLVQSAEPAKRPLKRRRRDYASRAEFQWACPLFKLNPERYGGPGGCAHWCTPEIHRLYSDHLKMHVYQGHISDDVYVQLKSLKVTTRRLPGFEKGLKDEQRWFQTWHALRVIEALPEGDGDGDGDDDGVAMILPSPCKGTRLLFPPFAASLFLRPEERVPGDTCRAFSVPSSNFFYLAALPAFSPPRIHYYYSEWADRYADYQREERLTRVTDLAVIPKQANFGSPIMRGSQYWTGAGHSSQPEWPSGRRSSSNTPEGDIATPQHPSPNPFQWPPEALAYSETFYTELLVPHRIMANPKFDLRKTFKCSASHCRTLPWLSAKEIKDHVHASHVGYAPGWSANGPDRLFYCKLRPCKFSPRTVLSITDLANHAASHWPGGRSPLVYSWSLLESVGGTPASSASEVFCGFGDVFDLMLHIAFDHCPSSVPMAKDSAGSYRRNTMPGGRAKGVGRMGTCRENDWASVGHDILLRLGRNSFNLLCQHDGAFCCCDMHTNSCLREAIGGSVCCEGCGWLISRALLPFQFRDQEGLSSVPSAKMAGQAFHLLKSLALANTEAYHILKRRLHEEQSDED